MSEETPALVRGDAGWHLEGMEWVLLVAVVLWICWDLERPIEPQALKFSLTAPTPSTDRPVPPQSEP